jgi:hypothetical protein
MADPKEGGGGSSEPKEPKAPAEPKTPPSDRPRMKRTPESGGGGTRG